jgi:PKD repeat protein
MRCLFGISGREASGAQAEGSLERQNCLPARTTTRRWLILLLAPLLLLLAIQKSPAPVLPSWVFYTNNPTNGLAPLTVQFNAAATNTTGGYTVTNWVWNFNDGTPPVTGQNPVHTYTGGGAFTVSETCYCTNLVFGGGIALQGSISMSTVTPAVITTTGAVATVTGYVYLPTEPAGFYVTNGVVLVSLPGTFPGNPIFPSNPAFPSDPVRATAVTIMSDGSGFWLFSAQISLPFVLYPNGTYAQPTWPSHSSTTSNPLVPNDEVIIFMEYNDGQGHTGILVGAMVPILEV